MTEETNQKDGDRPLSPEERIAMRKLLRILDNEEKIESVEKLVKHEPVLTEVSTNFMHMSWISKMMYKIAIYFVGIVGAVMAYTNLKSWAGIK